MSTNKALTGPGSALQWASWGRGALGSMGSYRMSLITCPSRQRLIALSPY
jgi:hypothetical protein